MKWKNKGMEKYLSLIKPIKNKHKQKQHAMKKVFLSAILMAGTAGVLSSCNDSTNDMTPQPQQGTFTVENVVLEQGLCTEWSLSGNRKCNKYNYLLLLPGQSISFKFNAGKGQRLMFATMYGCF